MPVITRDLKEIMGINTRNLPSPDGQFCQVVVLKRLHGDFYRCYTGIVRDTSLNNPAYEMDAALWIMPHGNKLSYEEALMHFPSLEKDRYYK